MEPVARPGVVKYECPEQTYHHENMHMHNGNFKSDGFFNMQVASVSRFRLERFRIVTYFFYQQ